MAIIDLVTLDGNKVSKDLIDYSLLITAPTGYGKTPFLFELFGERALFLSFENSSKGIAGIHSVQVEDFNNLNAYLMQLQNPEVRKKYDIIVIDTLFLFDHYIEKSIVDAYGKETLGDCLKYNKAYKIVDKKFLDVIKKIQRMDYTMAYVCHPVEKKVKLANGEEMVKIEPKVSDRIKNLLLPEIDVRIFCHFDEQGNKVIYTQGNQFFDARIRVGDIDPVIPFDAQSFKDAFAEGIKKRITNQDMLIDKLEHKNPAFSQHSDFKEVMDKIIEIGKTLAAEGKIEEGNFIINKELGLDDNGNQRGLGDCSESMLPTLELILDKLKLI